MYMNQIRINSIDSKGITGLVSALFVATLLVFGGVNSAGAFGIPTPVGGDQAPQIDEVQAPQSVSVVNSTPKTITVSWVSGYRSILADAASGIVGYEVDVYEKKSGDFVKTVTTTNRQATVTELSNNKAYIVRVRAQSGAVESDDVEISGRTTPVKPKPKKTSIETRTIFRDVITNKPLNAIEGASGGKYQARLKWAPAAGKIRYYSVRVYEVGADEPLKAVTAKKARRVISGLKQGKTYEYTVSAHFNDEYFSAESKRKSFTVKKKKRK